MSNNGEKSRPNPSHLKALYASTHQTNQDLEYLSGLTGGAYEKYSGLLARAIPWGRGYEIPFYTATICLLALEGVLGSFIDALKSDSPYDRLIALMEDPPLPDDIDEVTLGKILCLLFVQNGNREGFQRYSTPISTMVDQVRGGDDEWLFKAVSIDRAVLEAAPVAKRVCVAQAEDDRDFLHQLAKAITGTRPRRPDKSLDDARLMIEILDEAIGLKDMTHEAIYDLIVADLELYPDDGKDPMSGLKKLIQKRNKTVGN